MTPNNPEKPPAFPTHDTEKEPGQPPEGFKIIPREWLEAGNPLPEDALFSTNTGAWIESYYRYSRVPHEANEDGIDFYATAQPLPCFMVPSPDQEPQPEQRMAKEQPGTHDLGPICGPHKGDPLSRQMLEKVIVAVMEEPSCDQGPEHNPDGLTPEQYGAPEWRLLREDEETTEGDEMRRYDGLWILAGWPMSVFAGHPITYRRRRRVNPEPAQTPGQRIAELERENSVLWEQLADRDKLVADYRTQLAASEKDRQWQPIATAPKGGGCAMFIVTNNITARNAHDHLCHLWLVDMVFVEKGEHYAFLENGQRVRCLTHWFPISDILDAAMKEAK